MAFRFVAQRINGRLNSLVLPRFKPHHATIRLLIPKANIAPPIINRSFMSKPNLIFQKPLVRALPSRGLFKPMIQTIPIFTPIPNMSFTSKSKIINPPRPLIRKSMDNGKPLLSQNPIKKLTNPEITTRKISSSPFGSKAGDEETFYFVGVGLTFCVLSGIWLFNASPVDFSNCGLMVVINLLVSMIWPMIMFVLILASVVYGISKVIEKLKK